ncbi:hypothetical protein [Yersinia phage vB_YenM_P778]
MAVSLTSKFLIYKPRSTRYDVIGVVKVKNSVTDSWDNALAYRSEIIGESQIFVRRIEDFTQSNWIGVEQEEYTPEQLRDAHF